MCYFSFACWMLRILHSVGFVFVSFLLCFQTNAYTEFERTTDRTNGPTGPNENNTQNASNCMDCEYRCALMVCVFLVCTDGSVWCFFFRIHFGRVIFVKRHSTILDYLVLLSSHFSISIENCSFCCFSTVSFFFRSFDCLFISIHNSYLKWVQICIDFKLL